jgi:hypothetical protein
MKAKAKGKPGAFVPYVVGVGAALVYIDPATSADCCNCEHEASVGDEDLEGVSQMAQFVDSQALVSLYGHEVLFQGV